MFTSSNLSNLLEYTIVYNNNILQSLKDPASILQCTWHVISFRDWQTLSNDENIHNMLCGWSDDAYTHYSLQGYQLMSKITLIVTATIQHHLPCASRCSQLPNATLLYITDFAKKFRCHWMGFRWEPAVPKQKKSRINLLFGS